MKVIGTTQIGVIDDGGWFGGMAFGLMIGDERRNALAVQPADPDSAC